MSLILRRYGHSSLWILLAIPDKLMSLASCTAQQAQRGQRKGDGHDMILAHTVLNDLIGSRVLLAT
jgi:hypothetical protein